ncbi:hypothetical protein QQ045_007783 [Rhodiola kirilowii]
MEKSAGESLLSEKLNSVTVGSMLDESRWKAYDPEADRWHAIPPTPMPSMNGERRVGFSCVSVCNRFLVIGGLYFDCDRLVVTNQVFSFDPYRQEWSVLASMSTPRAKFACSVISDKVWEDLPTMPNPRYGRFGISYNSKFYFRDDGSDLYDGETTDMFIFSPLDGQWCSRHDEWQKPPILIHDICVINDNLYTFMYGDNFKEMSVETFNTETEDWVRVGLVPAVTLPDNPEYLKWVGGEICGLRNKIYIMGGLATIAQKLYQGSQCVNWRETTVSGGDCDYITSCASLEELQR